MSLLALFVSSVCSVSEEECMYLTGIETATVGIPLPTVWMYQAPVPVSPLAAQS